MKFSYLPQEILKTDYPDSYYVSQEKYVYHKNSKFSFGLYSGYKVGIVYTFDADYIRWCIKNVDTFFISDLEELQGFGILKNSKAYQPTRKAGIPGLCYLINEFESMQELSKIFGMANTAHLLDKEIIDLNRSRKPFDSD